MPGSLFYCYSRNYRSGVKGCRDSGTGINDPSTYTCFSLKIKQYVFGGAQKQIIGALFGSLDAFGKQMKSNRPIGWPGYKSMTVFIYI